MLVKLQRPPPEMRIFLPNRVACSMTPTRRPRLPASIAHIRPAAPPPRIKTSNEWITGRSHVEQAEPWQVVLFQQPLVDVLLLQLIDLRRRHFAAIRCKVAVSLGPNHYHLFILGSGEQSGEEFFFEHSQVTLQVFQSWYRLLIFHLICQFAEGTRRLRGGSAHGNSAALGKFRRFQRIGVASQENCDCVRLKALSGGGFGGKPLLR